MEKFAKQSAMKPILKVLVGSWSHGLADPNSDYDYRAVYILPTTDILSLGYTYKGTDWIEGVEDNTSYELGHFLHLAMKCNPTILEVFKAPLVEAHVDGVELRELFQYIWNPKDAYNAFIGYGLNQRKKFLDRKDDRAPKYAVAYLRTLWNLIDLLGTKTFDLKVTDEDFKKTLLLYRKGEFTMGEIINVAEHLTEEANKLLPNCKQEPNIDKVNEFLLKMRQKYWNLGV